MSKRTIVIASNNKNKIKEIKVILPDFKVLSLEDAGIESNPEETEMTFEGNALLKAKDAKKHTDYMVIADDSGLEVMCLNNLPGVYSKRFYTYEGTEKNKRNLTSSSIDKLNNKKLLRLMYKVKQENRNARFVSKIALIKEDDSYVIFSGECNGRILFETKGRRGFGYDPIFMPDESNITFAEMNKEQKNKISHRAAALMKLKEYLND